MTFEAAGEYKADTIAVVGDFNKWDGSATPMKRKKDGVWSATVRLDPGSYRYRYLADGQCYFNDPHADGYEASGLGEDNCIVVVG